MNIHSEIQLLKCRIDALNIGLGSHFRTFGWLMQDGHRLQPGSYVADDLERQAQRLRAMADAIDAKLRELIGNKREAA